MSIRKTRFRWEKFIISQCALCQNKHEGKLTCEAFPDGIPDEIIQNKKLHIEPIIGDNGIRFKPYN